MVKGSRTRMLIFSVRGQNSRAWLGQKAWVLGVSSDRWGQAEVSEESLHSCSLSWGDRCPCSRYLARVCQPSGA